MNTGLERYINFLESISDSVPESVAEVVAPHVHFRDPFNDLHGIAAYKLVIADMCENLAGLSITITHASEIQARDRESLSLAVIRWELSGNLIAFRHKPWRTQGYAELAFSDDQRLSRHFDYWDAAGGLYEHLPVIGGLCRWVRRRLAVRFEDAVESAAQ